MQMMIYANIKALSPATNVMGHRQNRSTIQQDLDDLVIVPVGRQYKRGDVRRERRRVGWQCFPTLQHKIIRTKFRDEFYNLKKEKICHLYTTHVWLALLVHALLVLEQHLNRLDELLGNGV